LLTGDYDEADSAAAFQQALMAWRGGDEASPKVQVVSPRKAYSPVKSPSMSIKENS